MLTTEGEELTEKTDFLRAPLCPLGRSLSVAQPGSCDPLPAARLPN